MRASCFIVSMSICTFSILLSKLYITISDITRVQRKEDCYKTLGTVFIYILIYIYSYLKLAARAKSTK